MLQIKIPKELLIDMELRYFIFKQVVLAILIIDFSLDLLKLISTFLIFVGLFKLSLNKLMTGRLNNTKQVLTLLFNFMDSHFTFFVVLSKVGILLFNMLIFLSVLM